MILNLSNFPRPCRNKGKQGGVMINDKTSNQEAINDIPTKQEVYQDSVNNCPICGTHLSMTHRWEQALSQVKEEAVCPACEIQVRSEKFTLH